MLWAALLLLLYGYFEAQAIRLRSKRIVLKRLPRAFEGFTIVLLSDLHTSSYGRREKRLCELLRTVEADLVVFAGDFKRRTATNDAPVAAALKEISRCLRSRLTPLAVLGNKDNAGMTAGIEDAGIDRLSGRAKRLTRQGETLWIAGVDSFNLQRLTRALISATSEIPDGSFKILLSHGPDVAPLANALGYDLILCGDTHGGQIRLPLIGAVDVKSEISRRYCRGILREGSATLCISAGIGTCAFPVRLLCPPEVLLLTLHREQG